MSFFDSDSETQIRNDDTDITGSKSAVLIGAVNANNSASFLKTNLNGELLTTTTGSVIAEQGPSGSNPWKITIKDSQGDEKGISANPMTINADSLPLPSGASTESTLNAIRDNIGESVPGPTADTLMGRTQELIDLLTSIKDTEGIQTIDDIIRLGDLNRNGIDSVLYNAIRRIETRTFITSPSGTLNVDVFADNNINRLETRNTIVGQITGSGPETKVTVIDDSKNNTSKRLQVESRIAPGSVVNIGTIIPEDPKDLKIKFLTDVSGSENMLVDGSVTPVTFSYTPPVGKTVIIQDVLLVFTSDNAEFDGKSFGAKTKLSNGILFQIKLNGTTADIFTIVQNEDFLRVPGRNPVINNTGPKDAISSTFSFGGRLQLSEPDGDKINFIIRDDLITGGGIGGNSKILYLTATIYGIGIE